MLSYRHAFHAGNFADVLKHTVLVEILEYLTQKEKGFDFFDTHAGAGLYDLRSEHAEKLNEAAKGIGKLIPGDWPELARYFEVINRCNSPGALHYYPGSPLFARHFLRPQDKAWLFELHPRDFESLREATAQERQTKVQQADGLKGLLSLLPPASRRGLILIDPSYEVKTDYQTVFNTILSAHRKFSTGIYALWYPVVDRQKINQLETHFINSGMKDIQRFELGLERDTDAQGMTASGMIVINPPWTLMNKMRLLLPKLASALGAEAGAFFKCDRLVNE